MVAVAVNGIFHLACTPFDIPVGSAFIDTDNPIAPTPLASLFQSSVGIKAVGGYTIISGLLLMSAPALLYWNLSKNKTNRPLCVVSWSVCCVVVLFNFTSAILAAQIYTPAAKYANASNSSLSDYGKEMSLT